MGAFETAVTVLAVRGGTKMRRMISSGVLVLAMVTTPAQSQEWRQYLAFDDFFSISFPGEPTIRGTTYRTEYGIVLPAKTYTAEDFLGSYVSYRYGLGRGAGAARRAFCGVSGERQQCLF